MCGEHRDHTCRNGNINNNNTGCVDDVALISQDIYGSQIMVNMAIDLAKSEGYELQPKKSPIVPPVSKLSGHPDIVVKTGRLDFYLS
jgi:hypothetical protein